MIGPSASTHRTLAALRAAVCALAITGCGCFSVYVAPAVPEPDTAVERNAGPVVRSPAIVAFYCYGHTVWGRVPLHGCDQLKSVASRMIAGALPQSATEAEPRDLLEISVEQKGDPLPQPLAFVRGFAGFVTEMASPVTVSSETRWTLEVSVTSTSGAAATRRYETAAFETGGLLPTVSLPSPPSDARLILRDSRKSHASLLNSQAESEIVRSLIAAFLVEADPSACATLEESSTIVTAASPPDRDVIRAACRKLRAGDGVPARRPTGG
jgi:hypothetical protein